MLGQSTYHILPPESSSTYYLQVCLHKLLHKLVKGMLITDPQITDLIFVKSTLFFPGTREVVDVGAACLEASYWGALLVAAVAGQVAGTLERHLHIHECTIHCLIHFVGPEGAVEVDPLVHVHVQQPEIKRIIRFPRQHARRDAPNKKMRALPGCPICISVSGDVAEDALPLISRHLSWLDRVVERTCTLKTFTGESTFCIPKYIVKNTFPDVLQPLLLSKKTF